MAALTFPSFSNAETGKDTENNSYFKDITIA